jgi:hypothetical protein
MEVHLEITLHLLRLILILLEQQQLLVAEMENLQLPLNLMKQVAVEILQVLLSLLLLLQVKAKEVAHQQAEIDLLQVLETKNHLLKGVEMANLLLLENQKECQKELGILCNSMLLGKKAEEALVVILER